MRRMLLLILSVLLMLASFSACEIRQDVPATEPIETNETIKTDQTNTGKPTDPPSVTVQPAQKEETEKVIAIRINETKVAVEWENNDSVEALKALCRESPLVIEMSMYGGFEQVGPLGARLPSNDVQTKTSAGDIVLYSSNQIVVFYGSNTWAYTRLGHITDRSAADMAALLGNGNVTITIGMEDAE